MRPATLESATTVPEQARNCGNKAWSTRIPPVTLTSNISVNCARSAVSIFEKNAYPPLLTKVSTGEKAFAAATALLTAVASRTSSERRSSCSLVPSKALSAASEGSVAMTLCPATSAASASARPNPVELVCCVPSVRQLRARFLALTWQVELDFLQIDAMPVSCHYLQAHDRTSGSLAEK